MNSGSHQYARLADASYRTADSSNPRELEINLGGVSYQILEQSDRPSGYQGTLYQRTDTGDIVVSHRGTELDSGTKAIVQDVVMADGGMVIRRANLQADDAIELTRRALAHAVKSGPDYGDKIPSVTVIGHSLGGVLAQITAHHFDLRGETFNAYGAVSLGYRIPEGGNAVINHVMSGDTVSAASQHYGQVRMYTTGEEVRRLQDNGYENNRNVLDMRSPVNAALGSLGSHGMHNFLDVDAKERRDVSVLEDPKARQLAEQYAPMFEKYRDDVALVRGGLTLGGRSGLGLAQDSIDLLRGHLPAGEPARREDERDTPRLARGTAGRPFESELFKPDGPLSLPEYLSSRNGPQPPLRLQDSRAAPLALPDDVGQPVGPKPISEVASYTARLDQMLESARSGDWRAFDMGTQTLAGSDSARAMREKAVETVDRQEQSPVHQQAGQQQLQQQESHGREISR